MRWIRNLSIRWKLVLVTVLTCTIAELSVGAVVAFYSSNSYETRRSEDIAVQADVLAASLTAPLVFGDTTAAREYLDAFKANREIAVAGAYAANGKLFASYAREGAARGLLPPRAPAAGPRIENDKLMVSRPVKQTGNAVGTVYLVANIDPLGTRLLRFGGLMFLAVIGSLLIAVPLSMRLNATISNAIRRIASAASRVTEGDLNVELPTARSTDEVGVLVSTFGKMMSSLRDMMQQERLRALGQMSSGIAHDINNAMSPMALHTQSLLERESDLTPRMRSYLETVKRVVDDVSATVGRMREFSRKREPEMALSPLDMNVLLRQVIDLTRARWSDIQQRLGFVIEIKHELAPDLPPIMGAQGEIREALTNLIFNAVDAMPEGGTLTLRTRATQTAGVSHVEIEVADSGIGMDEDTKRRCFEPFFTTKGERGTGLGMAMVYGMVVRHSAEIVVDSAIGKGTSIRLVFLACAPVQPESAREGSVARVAVPPMRILVVDDDPFVLDSMRMVLELDGHTIATAEGGQNGIDTFRNAQTSGDPFEFVITDLGMPYVDGQQVARAVKANSPSTPVILLTGWGRRMHADGEMPAHVDCLLAKPPSLDELRTALLTYGGR
jgi:signal transduction histidine kinase/ActR/RegA family two-component response regulator